MKLDASEAKSSKAPASSSGFPILPIGEFALIWSRNRPGRTHDPVISLGNQPGAIAFTLTPLSAQLAARLLVRLVTAPLVA